jgi:hypothetical protein
MAAENLHGNLDFKPQRTGEAGEMRKRILLYLLFFVANPRLL